MALLQARLVYKDESAQFEYPQAYEYFFQQNAAHWLHSEVPLGSDIQDWELNLTKAEKNVITNILKSFAQTEVSVNDYWRNKVGIWFPKPEIAMMSAAFSNMEAIHTKAYAYLNEQLNLEDYVAFLEDEESKNKIDRLNKDDTKVTIDIMQHGEKCKPSSKKHVAESLAIFSAFTEGVNLFSSFAILLSFKRFNKLKKIGNIVEWSVRDECVVGDTEVLTPQGWVEIKDYQEGTKVAQFDPVTKEMSFVLPERYIVKSVENIPLYHLTSNKNTPISQIVTENHRLYWRSSQTSEEGYKTSLAKDFNTHNNYLIPISGKLNQESVKHLSDFERLLIAIQADGSISNRYTGERSGHRPVTISIKKFRKKDRLRYILSKLDLEFSEKPTKKEGQTLFTIYIPNSLPVTKEFKDWVKLDELDYNWGLEFIEELSHWDGYIPKDTKKSGNYVYYSTINKDNADIVQAISHLSGKSATLTKQVDHRKDTYSDVYRIYIQDKDEKRLGGATMSIVDERFTGNVYCFTVDTGAFLVRHDNKVSVTGNCMHSHAGCWLFREFVKEYPEVLTDDLKERIYQAARDTVALECAFIDKVFELGPIEGLDPEDLKNFIKHRANVKLGDLGFNANWKNIDKEALLRMQWFDNMTGGAQSTDFFDSRVTQYSKGTHNWDTAMDFDIKDFITTFGGSEWLG